MDTLKKLVQPLALDRPMSVADPLASGRSWPLQSWACYIQWRPPLVDSNAWEGPITFLLRGDAYPCAGGGWTQLSIGLLNHGARGRTPAYLSVMGIAVCGDKDMAALAEKYGARTYRYTVVLFCYRSCGTFSRLILEISPTEKIL